MMINGWPASNAKKMPAADVDTSVSDMPIRLLVLSPIKHIVKMYFLEYRYTKISKDVLHVTTWVLTSAEQPGE
jgi:hypothetical protein